jgi:hypothetical protein
MRDRRTTVAMTSIEGRLQRRLEGDGGDDSGSVNGGVMQGREGAVVGGGV